VLSSNLLAKGYSQFPWELALNGWRDGWRRDRLCSGAVRTGACEAAELDPVPWQWILLHPSAGLGFSQFGLKRFDVSAKAKVVLDLELLGVVGYTNAYSQYYGGGLSLCFADLDFADPLPGLTLHLTRWIHLGYAVSMRKSTRWDGMLFLSADLFGLLSKGIELFR
jgi:hypothetical protein